MTSGPKRVPGPAMPPGPEPRIRGLVSAWRSDPCDANRVALWKALWECGGGFRVHGVEYYPYGTEAEAHIHIS